MISLFLFCSQFCFAMQQTMIDGNHLFFRDISATKYACYTIKAPDNTRLILAENWLAMDKESQHRFHSKTGLGHVGHENYRAHIASNSTDSDSSTSKICTFISGENEAADFCVNDYLASRTGSVSKFDGIQLCPPPLNHLDEKQRYYFVVARQFIAQQSNVKFMSDLYDSIRDDFISDGQIADIDLPMYVQSLALKYPHIVYSAQSMNGENYLIISDNTRVPLKITVRSNGSACGIPPLLKKLSWLQGKNLLGLTVQGDIVTIDVDKIAMYDQHFGNQKFRDIAVDMKHPWRFIALSENFSIIYGDFSSHHAVFREEKNNNVVSAVYNFVTSILNNAPVNTDKNIVFKSKNSYRTLMQLQPLTDSQICKIWFHNDKIGVYCGDKDNTNGTFDIYRLHDRILTFDMNQVNRNRADEECLQKSTLQLLLRLINTAQLLVNVQHLSW